MKVRKLIGFVLLLSLLAGCRGDSTDLSASPMRSPDLNSITSLRQLDLYANIETIGVVVSGDELPESAELLYRRSSDTIWLTGHPLVRITDGRLVSSLFGLSPSTSYTIKVFGAANEIVGSVTTQPDELQFTPSAIVHVDDDAVPNGDGSPSSPFQTIQEGVDNAGPGTRVLVADGVYHEMVSFSSSGVEGNWIQVIAEGAGAILDGSDRLAGDIWTLHASEPDVWFTDIRESTFYVARDQDRFYRYDNLPGLLAGLGHEGVRMDEGWYAEPGGSILYIRSLDNPANHIWRVARLPRAFEADNRDWLWIEGFEMRFYGNKDSCGVYLKDSSHVVIRHNKIHNIDEGLIMEWTGGEDRSNDTRIEYNEIYDTSVNEWPWDAVKGTSMEGTAIRVGGHQGTILRGNEIHHIFNGIYTGRWNDLENPEIAFDVDIYNNHLHHIGDDALEPEGACINNRFRSNTVDTTLVGISLAPITYGPTWVLRSVITDIDGKGIKWELNSDGVVLIYHNTIWTDGNDMNAMTIYSPVHNGTMRNNIFRGNRYALESTAIGCTGHDWDYDNWYTTYGSDGHHFRWEQVRYDTISELCATTGLECNGHELNPRLKDPSGGDFTLLPSSPNIDRGVVIPGINDDYNEEGPDIGAYESIYASPARVYRPLVFRQTCWRLES